jgi:hypothetical protein
MHKVIVGATAAMLVVVLAGCGGGGSGDVQQQDWIVGTWEYYAVSLSVDGPREPVEQFGIGGTVVFNADGTWREDIFKPNVGSEIASGTWVSQNGGWVMTNVDEGRTTRVMRDGSSVYYVREGGGNLFWFWLRRA